MAIDKIKFKRTSVAGRLPTPAQVDEGEFLINVADKKIYTKNHLGAIINIGGSGEEFIRQQYEETNVKGQTTFAVQYDVGFLDVEYNGVGLSSVDFTATDGVKVILHKAVAQNSDRVRFTAYRAGDVSEVNGTNIIFDPAVSGDTVAEVVNEIDRTKADITWVQAGLDTKADASVVGNFVRKVGDTMTGTLNISKASEGIFLKAPATGSASYIISSAGGVNNWYVGKGGPSDNVDLTSYKYQRSLSIRSDGIYITGAGQDGKIYSVGNKPNWGDVEGNEYFVAQDANTIKPARTLMFDHTISSIVKPLQASTGRVDLGNESSQFRYIWGNTYRGGAINISGNAAVGSLSVPGAAVIDGKLTLTSSYLEVNHTGISSDTLISFNNTMETGSAFYVNNAAGDNIWQINRAGANNYTNTFYGSLEEGTGNRVYSPRNIPSTTVLNVYSKQESDAKYVTSEGGAIENAKFVTVQDTRNVNTLPNALPDHKVGFDFKANSTNGFSQGGTYNAVMTVKQWSDGASGGYPSQLAFGQNNRMGVRVGTSDTAWGPWAYLYSTIHKPVVADIEGAMPVTTDNIQFNWNGFNSTMPAHYYHHNYPESDNTVYIHAYPVGAGSMNSNFEWRTKNGSSYSHMTMFNDGSLRALRFKARDAYGFVSDHDADQGMFTGTPSDPRTIIGGGSVVEVRPNGISDISSRTVFNTNGSVNFTGTVIAPSVTFTGICAGDTYNMANGGRMISFASSASEKIIRIGNSSNPIYETHSRVHGSGLGGNTAKLLSVWHGNTDKFVYHQGFLPTPAEIGTSRDVGSLSFGGSAGNWTTAEFIAWITAQGAFSTNSWSARGSWSYATNKTITDTGCGNIHLSGCAVEIIGAGAGNYTINISTPTTTSNNGTINAEFVYIFNGSSYAPSWRRIFNTKNPPTPAEVSSLAKRPTGIANEVWSPTPTGYDYGSSPLIIRERGGASVTSTDPKYSPNICFHWGGKHATSLYMNASGELMWGKYGSNGSPTTGGRVFTTANPPNATQVGALPKSGTNNYQGKLLVSDIAGAQSGTPTITLAIGDSDTGFKATSDGQTEYWSNNIARYNMQSVYHPNNKPTLQSLPGIAANSSKLNNLSSDAYLKDNGWNVNPGQDADTQPNMSTDFTYSNKAPLTGPLTSIGASGYRLQINSAYSGENARLMAFRTRNGDNNTWNVWNGVMTGEICYHGMRISNNWHKLAEVYMPNSASTACIEVTGGVGYNIGTANQLGTQKIHLRTGNGSPATGLNIVGFYDAGLSPLITDMGYKSIGGNKYEIYAKSGSYPTAGIIWRAWTSLNATFKWLSQDVGSSQPAGISKWMQNNAVYNSRAKPTILTSTSTSYFGITWCDSSHNVYQSSNQGFSIRPSDGHVKVKHIQMGAGGELAVNTAGQMYPPSSSKRTAGVYGVYDSHRIGHIWSMGTAYNIDPNGANFGDLYGFAYKHTNNTTGGTMGKDHMAVWCINGAPQVALGNFIWAARGLITDNRGSSWISQKDATNVAVQLEVAASSYAAGIRFKSTNRTFTMGSLGNETIGFYGYNNTETVNKTNFQAALDRSGNWFVSANITAYSDSRVKTDLEIIPDALDKVSKLNGYTYKRIDLDDDAPRHVGVIAQEVLEVLPEAVTGGATEEDPDAHYAVAYGNLSALLIEAIKELKCSVEFLKAQNESLTARVEELENGKK